MLRTDIPFAIQLTDQENWSIPKQDFERILRLNPRGSFIATEGMRRVGIATTASYGRKIAWIGNVVVREQYRGKHIGQTLVTHAINYLHKTHVKHVALYCFDENVEFYRKLGFIEGSRFTRLRREAKRASKKPERNDSFNRLTVPAILSLDRKAFGADRSSVILDLLNSRSASVFSVVHGQGRSYLLAKNYADMCELGPWVSFELSDAILDAVLGESLLQASGMPVEIARLLDHAQTAAMFRRHSFRVIKTGCSMHLHAIPRIGSPAGILALGFLDKG